MTVKTRLAAGFAALVLLAGAAGFVPGAHAQDMSKIIEYRRNVMKSLDAHTGDIVLILKGQVPYGADHVAAQAEAIHAMAALIPSLVPKGSGPEAGVETNALPAIWQEPDKFKALAAKLETESAKLIEVAKTGDKQAIGAQVQVMGREGCGACHKEFRKPPPQ
jgi:cytochrome c556